MGLFKNYKRLTDEQFQELCDSVSLELYNEPGFINLINHTPIVDRDGWHTGDVTDGQSDELYTYFDNGYAVIPINELTDKERSVLERAENLTFEEFKMIG